MTSVRPTSAVPPQPDDARAQAARTQDARIVPLRRGATGAELSDEALLAGCAVGDTAALGGLFDRHHAAVFHFVSRLLPCEPAEVDDLVQSTFLAAWRAAKRYGGSSAVRSYLFGIAANLVRHHVRSARRRRDAYARAPVPAAVAAGPAEAVIQAQQRDRIAAALDRLPHDLRTAYVMCDLEDIPGVEAARILEIRPGTMWRRLHDARRALREAIEGDRP